MEMEDLREGAAGLVEVEADELLEDQKLVGDDRRESIHISEHRGKLKLQNQESVCKCSGIMVEEVAHL